MTDDIEAFFDALLNRDWEDEDNGAFSWVSQRTWVKWWNGQGSGNYSRVYVEQAGPEMRTHP